MIFDALKLTVLRYAITWISLMHLLLWNYSNLIKFQISNKGMSSTLKRIYPIIRCIIDCTELFCPRPASPLKVPFIQARSIIERLDRNRTIWSSNLYQLYITKMYCRQKIVRRSSWLNEALLEKNYHSALGLIDVF